MVVSVAAADVTSRSGPRLILLYLGPIGFGTFFAGAARRDRLAVLLAAGLDRRRPAHRAQHGGAGPGSAVIAWNARQQLGFAARAGAHARGAQEAARARAARGPHRPAHLARQPARLRRGRLAGAGAGAAPRPPALGGLHRLRRLQAGERPARPRGRATRCWSRWARRCAARRAPSTRWPGWAATSSASSSPRSTRAGAVASWRASARAARRDPARHAGHTGFCIGVATFLVPPRAWTR